MIPAKFAATRVAGSFRDPSGHVFERDGRIFRTVSMSAAAAFDLARGSSFYEQALSDGRLIGAEVVVEDPPVEMAATTRYVLEHPRLPFVSHPYEWPFSLLKAAALFHLDFHLDALDDGLTLSDASAFNVQFVGARPIFIDTLSLRQYHAGELWAGYRQFCEQFLNPLLLRALLGIPHNAWYRGTLEGIASGDLRRLLPLRRKLSRNLMTHVILLDTLQKTAGGSKNLNSQMLDRAGLPLVRFKKLLANLRHWITDLEPADKSATEWRDYAKAHSYKADELVGKQRFVTEFVARKRPKQLWDIGCNRGDYSAAAVRAGVEYVVGFDSDQGALDLAFARAIAENLPMLPLFIDVTNPPPAQGWDQSEREGLRERARSDAIIALALIHHLSISRNVPLSSVVNWLVGLAPSGVLEFVPKTDPMVQQQLRLRKDIFLDYTRGNFLECLRAVARIERTVESSATGRLLVEFVRA